MSSVPHPISTRSPNPEPRSDHGLWRDQRGVVAFAGIVGGALLVGALWHLVSVGDAIIWRERAQDTADAAAFQNAVIQARGMNTIVLLNLIMALVMSFLVALRVIEIMLAALLVATTILCGATGVACALPELVLNAQIRLWDRDPQISQWVAKICAGVNLLERAAATAAPIFAAVHASVDTADDYDASFVLAVSPSLASPEFMSLPASADNRALISRVFQHTLEHNFDRCFDSTPRRLPPGVRRPPERPPAPARSQYRQGVERRWNYVAQERLGMFVSLPVMDDRIGELCRQAGNFFDGAITSVLARGPLEFVGPALRFVSSFKGRVFAAAPSLFCMPPAEGVESLGNVMREGIEQQVKDGCAQADERFRNLSEEERKKSPFYVAERENRSLPHLLTRPEDLPIDPNTGFNREKCRTQKKQELEAATKKAEDARKAMDKVLECVKPAKVWEVATNGNLFMQSFSFVWKGANSERADDMLDVGDREQSGNVVPIETSMIRAQAEMYFDCTGTWSGCDMNAMWQMRWRARLRRIQPLGRMAGEAFALALASGISHGAQRVFGNWAYGTNHTLGTDAKYGNASNYVRDPIQWALYELNKLGPDSPNDPIIH